MRISTRSTRKSLIEPLELRIAPATFLVTSISDSGPGSLRQAILNANFQFGPDTIAFEFAPGPIVFTPLTPLPAITETVIISGDSLPQYDSGPRFILNGSATGEGDGITISGPRASGQIIGLTITGFQGDGIEINGSNGVRIATCYIANNSQNGINVVSSSSVKVGGKLIPANLASGGSAEWGESNVIIGNGQSGVSISGGTGHLVYGNLIGIDQFGNSHGNLNGILMTGGVATIGDSAPSATNVISGNQSAGIHLIATTNTTISGNHIGVDVAGTRSVPNRVGVLLTKTNASIIGGQTPDLGNVISGNRSDGIYIDGANGSLTTHVIGNFIGTDSHGTSAVPNGNTGVTVTGSALIFIGGSGDSRNVISGNGIPGLASSQSAGIRLMSTGETRVLGNYIGLDATGLNDLGNLHHGVAVYRGGTTMIGSNQPLGYSNYISGNGGYGISVIEGGGKVSIRGNSIGTDISDRNAIGNDLGGIFLDQSTSGVLVSGFVDGLDSPPYFLPNIISGNHGPGIVVNGTGHQIDNNYIGTDRTGKIAIGNAEAGILTDGVNHTIELNVISGNAIGISGTGVGIAIRNNKIGTDLTGTNALPNHEGGLWLFPGTPPKGSQPRYAYNLITANVVSGNDGYGMLFSSAARVLSNFVGTDVTGTKVLGNGGTGIIVSGPANVEIGSAASSPNIIGGNGGGGILGENGATPALIRNRIGVTMDGADVGNHGDGVLMRGNGFNLTATDNIIGHNERHGIALELGTIIGNIQLTKNWIGVAAKSPGSIAIGNGGDGIHIEGSTSTSFGSLVIGTNYLAANDGAGILVDGLTLKPVFDQEYPFMIGGNFIGAIIYPANAALADMGDGIVLRNTTNAHVGGEYYGGNYIGGLPSDHASIRIIGGAYNSIHGTDIGFYNDRFSPAAPIIIEGGHHHQIGGGSKRDTSYVQGTPNELLGAGIRILGGSDHIISGNKITGGPIGIEVSDGLNHRISGNEIRFTNSNGMILQGSGLLVKENFVHGVGGNGMIIHGVGVRVEDNAISQSGASGMVFDGLDGNTTPSPDHGNIALDNVITRSQGAGIEVLAGRVLITRNDFRNNAGLPVDLAGDGPTANDPGDSDGGANLLQNSADLQSAILRDGQLIVAASFSGAPSRTLRFEYSCTIAGDYVHLGEVLVETDAAGHARPIARFSIVPDDTVIDVLVSDLEDGTTSEMSVVTVHTHEDVIAVGTGSGSKGIAKLVRASDPQETLFEVKPYGEKFRGGIRVARADIDGDGIDDLITAAARQGQSIKVYSGLDGSLISEFDATSPNYRGGVSVAAGDVDGDGDMEIVTALAAGAMPEVRIHDAASGAIESTFLAFAKIRRTGLNLSVGDLDGDGSADIVASTQTGTARVQAFTGGGDALSPVIRPFENQSSIGAFTTVISATPHTAGKIVVGSGAGTGGAIEYYNHAGSLLLKLPAFHGSPAGAVRLATADVNGDGVAEIIAARGGHQSPVIEVVRSYPSPDLPMFPIGATSGIFIG